MAMLPSLPLLLSLLGGCASPSAVPRTVADAPAQESVPALIARGRALLADGEPVEAQQVFERANDVSGGSRETEVWVLRCWLDQGRINDAMNAIDDLAADTEDAYTDYLRGMAFYRRAKAYMTQGVPDRTAAFSFNDASQFLQSATARNADFNDAYLALAEAAWYSQELDVAREAAEKAIDLEPRLASAYFMLGKVIFSQFSAAKAEDSRWQEARTLWEETVTTFREAATALGEPGSPAEIQLAADIRVQLGNAYAWEQKEAECIAAYAEAMGFDPTRVDYGQLYNTLATEESGSGFTAALTSGAKKFRERYGEENTSDATLQWWLGYGNFANGDYVAAEQAFLVAVSKWPAYSNAWFFIALSRYYSQNYAGALDALHEHWRADPANVVASVQQDEETNLAILAYLVGWAAENERLLDAAFVSDVLAAAEPDGWEHWNNVGLFYRDAGAVLVESDDALERENAQEYFERSYEAYVRAYELAPDKPHLLNDGAVLLHYYLGRDLELAKQMYEQSQEQAVALIEGGTLDGYDLELAQTARRDSLNNLARLEALMAESR